MTSQVTVEGVHLVRASDLELAHFLRGVCHRRWPAAMAGGAAAGAGRSPKAAVTSENICITRRATAIAACTIARLATPE